MKQYHKIQTIYKRDPATKHKTLLLGEFSVPEFGYLQDNEWVFTEKIDGTNIRVMVQDGRVEFGGKTDQAQIPARLEGHLRETFDAETLVRMFADGTCLYGEGCGAGIQKGGGNYYQDQRFVLFDVKVGEWWLKREAVEDIAAELGIPAVPVIGRGTLGDLVEMCQNGFTSQWGEFPAEGIVARPAVDLRTRGGQRIITKLKRKDFR